jgi:hypothetical protein
MKLNYSKKILIITLLVFIGVLVLDIVFTNLLWQKILSINNKIKQLNISAQERVKELNLKETIVNSAENRVLLEESFVAAGNAKTVEFVSYLETLAKDTGVKYNTNSLSYEVVPELGSSESVQFIRLRASVSGSWANVFAFLQTIEKLPKISSLNSVSFNLNSDINANTKSTTNFWSAELDFSVAKLKN